MTKRWLIATGLVLVALLIFKLVKLNSYEPQKNGTALSADVDFEFCRKVAALGPAPNYQRIKPYFEFLDKYLFHQEPQSGIEALSETEKPINGDIWFWADDNAKALECYALPGALSAYRNTVERMYEFLMSQTPGPFIFRRIAVDAIQFTQKDPENFKLNTGLMNFNGNLKKGIIFQGYRFHDDRVINSLLYSGSMIRLQYGEKTHVIDFEDNIVRAGIIHHKDALRLRQIAELYIDGRFVGNATIDLVVLHGKNYTRREATIKAAPGLELKNVQVALGYDNLSSNGKDLTYHRGFLWRRPGIFNSFECLGTPLQAISNGPIDWYALYQDENLGFSHAIITIPEKRDRVEAIVSEGVRAGRFHYVYTWYNLNDISDSASAGIAEKTILLAGGLYHSFPSYAPIFENLEHYSRKDMSISYDFGAELNAVAALAFREASDGIDYNTGKFFNEKTMVWFDEKFNAFRDNLLKTKLFKRPYLFSRGLAFAAIACDALYRATGNPKYLKWQFDCCDIIIDISKSSKTGRLFPHNDYSGTFLDTQAACVLALARTALLTKNKKYAQFAIDGLTAIEVRRNEHMANRIWVSYKPDDQKIGEGQLWVFKSALVARAVRCAMKLLDSGLISPTTDVQNHLADLLRESTAYISFCTRNRGAAKEILTSYRSAETNSESQPWGMLALIDIDQCYLSQVPPREAVLARILH